MVRCKKCGYENNDGSRVCLNCREELDEVERSISESEKYIQTNQTAITVAEEQAKKVSKTTLLVVLSLIAVFILGVVIYFANLYKPVVDINLLGSWQSAGYGYTDVWTFEKDGTYSMTRSGTGIFADGLDMDDWHYKAEGGRLKTSWSKNIDEYVLATYEYQFGVSEDGRQCLILKQINSGGGGSTQILYKID